MTSKKKIIVVDNNPVILKLLSTFLEKEGHQVVTAQDGIFAVDILRTFVPDIMFVDLIMPNLKGDKLCQIIRNNPKHQDIYIIIFSGIAVEDDKGIDFTSFGANACLAKGPFASLKNDIRALIIQADKIKGRVDHNTVIGVERLYKREITRELLDAKKHADVTLDNLSDAIFELTSDGTIVYANPKAVKLTGTAEKHLLAKDFLGLFQDKYIPIIKGSLNVTLTEKRTTKECMVVDLNDKEVSLQFIPLESEAILSVMVIAHDISNYRKKLMTLENDRDYAQLECSFKNDYIYGVSSAVKVVGSALEKVSHKIMTSTDTGRKTQDEWCGELNKTVLLLKEIAAELSQFSDQKFITQEHKLSVFSLEKAISQGMAFFQKEAKHKEINLLVDLPDMRAVELVGSSDGLSHVITGLSTMLLKICDKGELLLKCDITEEQDRDSIKCLFSLSNADMQLPVFSKNIYDFILPAHISCGHYPQNLGADLAIILHEVRDMSGEIWVEKTQNKGPVLFFTASFDTCQINNSLPSFTGVLAPNSPLLSKKLSILFLDDEIITSEFLVNTIEELTDWQAVVIENLAELPSTMADTKFDLVVVNVDITRPDTIAAANNIRLNLESTNLPIVALAEGTNEEQDQIREAGFDDCISKPVDIDDFFTVIERHL